MTQQDIENSISASFNSLDLCNTILSNSMDDLINGSFINEPYLFPIASSEDEVRYTLNKNREALEWILIEEWFETNVDESKVIEYETVVSASKAFNSLI